MASILAAALMVPEVPQLYDFAGAVSEEREQTGVLIKLLSGNRQAAVQNSSTTAQELGPSSQTMKAYGYTRCAVTMFGLECMLHFTLEFVSK